MSEILDKFKIDLPPINNYSSRKEWELACWQKILESEDILESLATSNERHNLVMRAAVINGINSGKKYKEIAEELWLSPQTISAIVKSVKENNYKSYRERGKTERKKKIYSFRPKKKKEYRGRRIRTKYGPMYVKF